MVQKATLNLKVTNGSIYNIVANKVKEYDNTRVYHIDDSINNGNNQIQAIKVQNKGTSKLLKNRTSEECEVRAVFNWRSQFECQLFIRNKPNQKRSSVIAKSLDSESEIKKEIDTVTLRFKKKDVSIKVSYDEESWLIYLDSSRTQYDSYEYKCRYGYNSSVANLFESDSALLRIGFDNHPGSIQATNFVLNQQ